MQVCVVFIGNKSPISQECWGNHICNITGEKPTRRELIDIYENLKREYDCPSLSILNIIPLAD